MVKKCSAGQQWSDDKKQCLGEPIKLDLKEAKEANEILNQQLEVIGDSRQEKN